MPGSPASELPPSSPGPGSEAGSFVTPVTDVRLEAIWLPTESFLPPVTGVGLEVTWLIADVLEEFELSLEELLEPGVQPIMKRRTAPKRTAASL